jgi:uncharacterized protein (DUF1697 family)
MNVALLCAVNVAGHGALSMAKLRETIVALGFADVRTVLQTGNIVLGRDRRPPAAIERALEGAIQSDLGVVTDCFVRTGREWASLVADNPFRDDARRNPGRLVLMCLKTAPPAPSVAALQAAIRGPEVVRASGRHLYVVYPDGIGRSRLTGAVIERTLGTRGTARNWNTVLKLAGLVVTLAPGVRQGDSVPI